MKIHSKLLSMTLCLALIGFSSCSGDDDTASTDDAVDGGCSNFQAQWGDVATAISAYSENPTSSNCEAYKTALMDFYEEFEDCQYWGQEYQDAVDEVQEMDCSEHSS